MLSFVVFRCGSCNSDVYYGPDRYSETMSQSNFQTTCLFILW